MTYQFPNPYLTNYLKEACKENHDGLLIESIQSGIGPYYLYVLQSPNHSVTIKRNYVELGISIRSASNKVNKDFYLILSHF